MKLSYINHINNINFKPLNEQKKNHSIAFSAAQKEIKELPSVYPQGVSQINSNMPVSYSKIGEITVPGYEQKASVFKLGNGQKVVIMPKEGSTCIRTTFNVGNLNESENNQGISHFIEHSLFNGSKNLAPGEYAEIATSLGSGTDAGTGILQTNYALTFQQLKDNSLEEAIKLNAMQTQYPIFLEEQIEKEKKVVNNENCSYFDDPIFIANKTMINNLFGINSEFNNPSTDVINSLNREQLFDYYNTWYTPDNAVTVITGDVDVDETIQLISKYYNKKSDFSCPDKRTQPKLTPIDKHVRKDFISPSAKQPYVEVGFAIPEGNTKEDINKLSAIIEMLNKPNSPFKQKFGDFDICLVDMQNNPNGVKMVNICFSVQNESMVEDTLKAFYEELTKLSVCAFPENIIEDYKQQAIKELEIPEENSNDLNKLLTQIVTTNNTNFYEEKKQALNNLSSEDVSNLTKKFFDLNKISICVSHTAGTKEESIVEQYNEASTRNKTISFGRAQVNPSNIVDKAISDIEQYHLWNNIETFFTPSSKNNNPTYNISIKNELLESVPATKTMVLQSLLNNNAETSVEIKDNKLIFSSTCDDEDLASSLKLTKEKLLNPNFTQEEFDKAKEKIRNLILAEPDDSKKILYNFLYPNMPKYSTQEEKLKQLETLQLSDIQNLYASIFANAQVTADLCGSIKENPQIKDIFNFELSTNLPMFQAVTQKQQNTDNIYKPNMEAKTITSIQDTAQADIWQGYTYKQTGNIEDIAKIQILENVLSGPSSRLFNDLRQEEGIAYSVGARCDGEKDCGVFLLGILTPTEEPEGSPENVQKALAGFKRNVDLLKTQNISEEELERAKTILKTKILNKYETKMDKHNTLLEAKETIYGVNYDKYLLEAIDKITVEDVKAAANYVFKNEPTTSIVANKSTIDSLDFT